MKKQMNNNSNAGLPYEVVATQSLMCQWLSLNEVRKIKEMAKDDKWLNHLHNFKHGLWLTENGLAQRQTLLFKFQCRYEDSAKKDIAIINRLLGEVTDALTPDIEMLKRCLFKLVSYNDCVYESILAEFLTVGTLLHHAVRIFDELDNPWKYISEGYDIHKTIKRIKPEREVKNFEDAVLSTKLLPDGIDYLADMDVRNCVKILSKRMDTQFIQKFTNKGKNVDIAA